MDQSIQDLIRTKSFMDLPEVELPSGWLDDLEELEQPSTAQTHKSNRSTANMDEYRPSQDSSTHAVQPPQLSQSSQLPLSPSRTKKRPVSEFRARALAFVPPSAPTVRSRTLRAKDIIKETGIVNRMPRSPAAIGLNTEMKLLDSGMPFIPKAGSDSEIRFSAEAIERIIKYWRDNDIIIECSSCE